jgi:hypothetical protein
VLNNIERKYCSFPAILQHSFARKQPLDNLLNVGLGDFVEFGVMPQSDISEAKLKVGGEKIYAFKNHNFVSYDLFDDKEQLRCSMIISNQDGTKPYLAISKLIANHRKRHVCTDEDLEMLKNGKPPSQLYVRENTATMTNWLNLRYKLHIKNLFGTCISNINEVMNFEYSLYAANNNDKILEIERYPSGEINIFATILISTKHITISHH